MAGAASDGLTVSAVAVGGTSFRAIELLDEIDDGNGGRTDARQPADSEMMQSSKIAQRYRAIALSLIRRLPDIGGAILSSGNGLHGAHRLS